MRTRASREARLTSPFLGGALPLLARLDYTHLQNQLKKPHSITFSKANEVRPFEDTASLNFWASKNDASLFLIGTHTKKRPHGLIWARCFAGEVMELLEVGIEEVMAMSSFKGIKSNTGSVPLFHFSAVEPHSNLWDTHPTFTQFKSLLLDFFRGHELDGVALKGLERVVSVTIGGSSSLDDQASKEGVASAVVGKGKAAVESVIGAIRPADANQAWDEDKSLPVVHFRTYTVHFMRSGLRQPRVELAPHGPHFTFSMRRSQAPAAEVWKEAMKKQEKKSAASNKKNKNVDIDEMGDKVGRVYLNPQVRSRSSSLQLFPALGLSFDANEPPHFAGPLQAAIPQVQGSQAQARRDRRCGGGRRRRGGRGRRGQQQEAEGMSGFASLGCGSARVVTIAFCDGERRPSQVGARCPSLIALCLRISTLGLVCLRHDEASSLACRNVARFYFPFPPRHSTRSSHSSLSCFARLMATRATFPRLAQTFADKQALLKTVKEACGASSPSPVPHASADSFCLADNSSHTFSVTASTDRIVTFRCSSRRRGDRDACTAHLTARRAETKAPWAVTEVNNRHSCTVPPTPVAKPVVDPKKRAPPASTAKVVNTSPALAEIEQKPTLRPSTPFKLVFLSNPPADDAQGSQGPLDAAPPSPISLRAPDAPPPPAKKRRRSVAASAARKSAQKPPAPISTATSSSSPQLPILDLRTPSPPPLAPQPPPSTAPLVDAATPFSLVLSDVGFGDPSLVASLLYLSPGTLNDFLAQVKVEYGEDTRKRMSDFVLSWREMGRSEGFG